MAWTIQNNIDHYTYPNGYYWDPNINPNAVWRWSLANCTTLAYGRVKEEGYPAPVTVIKNAEKWHEVVNSAENWQVIPYYDDMLLYPGDIVQWIVSSSSGHVAVVETQDINPYVSNSYFTGNNGSVSAYRTPEVIGGNTLQALSNYFYNNYPFRFYHYNQLSQENINVGRKPSNIIRYNGETPEPPTPPEPPLDTFNKNMALAIWTISERRRKRGSKLYTKEL